MLDLTKFTTEQRNQRSMDLDTMTSLQIVATMNDEDLRAVQSVTKVLPQVATAIDWAAEALERASFTWAQAPAVVWAYSTLRSVRPRLACHPI